MQCRSLDCLSMLTGPLPWHCTLISISPKPFYLLQPRRGGPFPTGVPAGGWRWVSGDWLYSAVWTLTSPHSLYTVVHSLYNSSSYTSFEPVPAFFCCKLTNITTLITLVWLRDWQSCGQSRSVNKNNLPGEIMQSYCSDIIMIMWGFFTFGKITPTREQEGQVWSV